MWEKTKKIEDGVGKGRATYIVQKGWSYIRTLYGKGGATYIVRRGWSYIHCTERVHCMERVELHTLYIHLLTIC